MLYQYLADAPVDDLQRSIIFDDYGGSNTFNWDMENGKYTVTVSIGYDGHTYAKQVVTVEGTKLFDVVATTPAQPYRTASVTIDVIDGNVTLETGASGEYTMLNWMSIEPAN